MSTSAFLLVIVAALLHASWNLAAKKCGGGVVFAFATGLCTAALWLPIVVALVYFSPEDSPTTWSGSAWAAVILSAAIHAVYFVVLLHGYRVAPLSVVYPIARGTGPLLSSFCAVLLFDELVTVSSVTGILLIVVGVFLLAWQRPTTPSDQSIRSGIVWGMLTGLTIALYTLVDGYAIKVERLNPLVYDYVASLLRVAILLPFVIYQTAELKRTFSLHTKGIVIVSVLGPLAYVLVLSALQLAPLSRVAPVREVSMLFGAFFGGKFLKEGSLIQRMSAAALIAAGILMLT